MKADKNFLKWRRKRDFLCYNWLHSLHHHDVKSWALALNHSLGSIFVKELFGIVDEFNLKEWEMLLITILAKFPVLTWGEKLWVKLIRQFTDMKFNAFFEYEVKKSWRMLEKIEKILREQVPNNFVLIRITTKFWVIKYSPKSTIQKSPWLFFYYPY